MRSIHFFEFVPICGLWSPFFFRLSILFPRGCPVGRFDTGMGEMLRVVGACEMGLSDLVGNLGARRDVVGWIGEL